MCRPSYLHLTLLLALVSSTVTSTHAKTSHHHLRQIAATATKGKRALLSIKQQQNEQPVVASNNEIDASTETETAPTVGLPYTEKVEMASSNEDSDRHSTLQDRHGPTLPDRIPHDVDSTTITFKPTGGGPDPAGTVDPSLGLPFLVVIGGGTLFVLTAVIVAAKKMRNNDEEEEEEDEDGDNNADDDIEAADAAKEHGAVTKPAMDFSSIVPGVEEEAS